MLKIGITGGIGCGKSLVVKFLQQEGIIIISADQIAKEIVNSNNEVKQKLITEFGADIYTPQGMLDRKKVANIVFSNAKARDKINAIVHPVVISRQSQELIKIEQSGNAEIAGVEAALIYEAHTEQQFDVVIVVSAPLEDVIKRLQQRDGLSRSQILKRVNSQLPVAKKIERADYVIHNNGSVENLKIKVKVLAQWLNRKAKMKQTGQPLKQNPM